MIFKCKIRSLMFLSLLYQNLSQISTELGFQEEGNDKIFYGENVH
jgi:hypothetical protein